MQKRENLQFRSEGAVGDFAGRDGFFENFKKNWKISEFLPKMKNCQIPSGRAAQRGLAAGHPRKARGDRFEKTRHFFKIYFWRILRKI